MLKTIAQDKNRLYISFIPIERNKVKLSNKKQNEKIKM
jgi:hypothetical protein